MIRSTNFAVAVSGIDVGVAASRKLTSYHAQVDIYDPWIDIAEAEHEYGVTPLTDTPQSGTYDAIILAVAHPEFL